MCETQRIRNHIPQGDAPLKTHIIWCLFIVSWFGIRTLFHLFWLRNDCLLDIQVSRTMLSMSIDTDKLKFKSHTHPTLKNRFIYTHSNVCVPCRVFATKINWFIYWKLKRQLWIQSLKMKWHKPIMYNFNQCNETINICAYIHFFDVHRNQMNWKCIQKNK